jgi:hypothetical protein
MMARFVNPAMQELEMTGSQFEASLVKKLARPSLENKPGMAVYAYNSSYLGNRDRQIAVQSWPR